MQPLGVMITNGGAHPPEDWAETTANKILDLIRVPSEAVSAELAEADRIAVEAGREAARQAKNLLKPQIVAALLSAHVDVHAGEAAALAADGAARAAAPADPGAHTEVDAVLAAVHALFEKDQGHGRHDHRDDDAVQAGHPAGEALLQCGDHQDRERRERRVHADRHGQRDRARGRHGGRAPTWRRAQWSPRSTPSSQVTLSKAHTGTITTATITFTGDAFKVALIKVSPTGTYGAASVNYSDITGNSDEVSGTGYTAGGIALTNSTPTTSGTTAFTDFADVSWTTASFSTTACMIYNTSAARRDREPCGVDARLRRHADGDRGTFTLVFPTPDASNAILRIA
jgi:hypothetical protein